MLQGSRSGPSIATAQNANPKQPCAWPLCTRARRETMLQGSRSGPLLSTFSNVPASPKWSMKGKALNVQKGSTPGPGAYSETTTNKYSTSPNYGFGGAAREGIRPASAPGPGQYKPTMAETQSAKYGFGTSDRVGIKNRHDQPGPASYQIPGKMGSGGPSYSSTTGRRINAGYNATPGPGAYQPNEFGQSTYKRKEEWGFGTSPREGKGIGSSPGPGSYEQKTAIDQGEGPKFSMKPRHSCKSSGTTPGPGEYGGIYTQFG